MRWYQNELSWLSPTRMHSLHLRHAVASAMEPLRDSPGGVALDYGCGRQPYRNHLEAAARLVVGVDLSSHERPQCIIGPEGPLPFADQSIDLLTSFQVLEHVPSPQRYLREAARVARPGATLVLSAPSMWPFHPHPDDYRRWMLPGLIQDLREAGFEVETTWPVLNPVSTAVQYVMSLFRSSLWYRGRLWRVAIRFLSLVANLTIAATECLFSSLVPLGAGNYVVRARRRDRDGEAPGQ